MTAPDRPILEKSRPGTSILDFDLDVLSGLLRQKLAGLHNVVGAYLFGSAATNQAHLWSDIDLVIVTETTEPFLERPRQFFALLDLGVPIDILVYTPEEFERLQVTPTGFWQNFRETHRRLL